MIEEEKNNVRKAYAAFNERNVDEVLSLFDKNVHWPNGWEGGYVEGHKEVRDYWKRQWKELNPKVYPVSFSETEDGRIEVQVHQVVKNLQGNIVLDGMIKHIYTFEKGLIKSMQIEKK